MVHFINNATNFFCNSSVINNKHEVLLVSVLEFESRGTARKTNLKCLSPPRREHGYWQMLLLGAKRTVLRFCLL